MPMNWQDKAVQDRLLAAIIASVDNKIQPREIARIYGQNMTYDALECRLRSFRKEAKRLLAEAEGRDIAQAPARARGGKAAGEKKTKGKGAVTTGRVVKNKAATTRIKKESLIDEILASDDGMEAYGDATEAMSEDEV